MKKSIVWISKQNWLNACLPSEILGYLEVPERGCYVLVEQCQFRDDWWAILPVHRLMDPYVIPKAHCIQVT